MGVIPLSACDTSETWLIMAAVLMGPGPDPGRLSRGVRSSVAAPRDKPQSPPSSSQTPDAAEPPEPPEAPEASDAPAAGEADPAAGNTAAVPDRPLSPEQAAVLIDFVTKLDRIIWPTWENIAPSSEVRRPKELAELMEALRAGRRVVLDESSGEALDQLRKMTSSMITAVGQLGAVFGRELAHRFGPAEIESLIEMEGKWMKAKGVRCWERYVELAEESMNAEAVEAEIRRSIARFVEALVRG